MIQCSFYERFISLVKQCFLFTWAYVHVSRDTATHLQCFTYEMLETSFTSISLSLCQSDVSWVQREWLSKYCMQQTVRWSVSCMFSCSFPLLFLSLHTVFTLLWYINTHIHLQMSYSLSLTQTSTKELIPTTTVSETTHWIQPADLRVQESPESGRLRHKLGYYSLQLKNLNKK